MFKSLGQAAILIVIWAVVFYIVNKFLQTNFGYFPGLTLIGAVVGAVVAWSLKKRLSV